MMSDQAVTANSRAVHLVGSVPLGDAEAVMRTASAILGPLLRRVPDGETGERTNWIAWQLGRFAQSADFDAVPPPPGAYVMRSRYRPRAGVDAARTSFGPFGYADAALASYPLFARLKVEGVVPPNARFQVALPTPLAPIVMYVVPEAQ